ncbi:hypothetical protein NIBR502772_06190 [Pseudarthrobacter sp. NIBRBAC000502772]|uniref:hypothetical protein n=1 Tax=Pseudarthrobacter sp. NIBRBAC000502772 TaxID=2590775 RepID=UPI0011314730|nr:hypothetical protein [Pseudarthrobacter sp. NIBRBAC000502772]QDG65862.1 hypothetical protein NIBR502772_06190 [Pseudarthrobacter sp. NIBRBAC000502772]
MVLPAGVTTCLVFKKAPVSFGGTSGGVEIEITPSVRLVHTETGTPLVDFIESVAPSEGGIAQVMLPHTDQTGFQDEAGNAFINWHYTARVRLKKTGHQPKHQPLFDFQIPSGQVTGLDLSLIPSGVAALPTSAPILTVTSINGQTGAADTYMQLARTPELLIVGAITRDSGGAPTSAAVVWPDGTAGTFTGTPSATFPGSLDSYTITYGTTRTYTQPTVTRDGTGTITNQPAIVLS